MMTIINYAFIFQTGSLWIRKLKDTKAKRISTNSKRTVTNYENNPLIFYEAFKSVFSHKKSKRMWKKYSKGPKERVIWIHIHIEQTTEKQKKTSFLMQCCSGWNYEQKKWKLLICSYTHHIHHNWGKQSDTNGSTRGSHTHHYLIFSCISFQPPFSLLFYDYSL